MNIETSRITDTLRMHFLGLLLLTNLSEKDVKVMSGTVSWLVAVSASCLAFSTQTLLAQEACDLSGVRPVLVRTSGELQIVGTGTRECSGSLPEDARIEILLKNDRRFWFDQTLASGEFTAEGFLTTRRIVYRCARGEVRKAYLELRNRSFGGKQQSPRASISCF